MGFRIITSSPSVENIEIELTKVVDLLIKELFTLFLDLKVPSHSSRSLSTFLILADLSRSGFCSSFLFLPILLAYLF